jgi:hypothetical protein
MTHRLHRLAKGLRQEVVTGGGVGCPSGSRSRRGGPAGRTRSRRLPSLARTRPPVGGVRCTSAACRTGCPRRGRVRSASGGQPGPVQAPPPAESRAPRWRPSVSALAYNDPAGLARDLAAARCLGDAAVHGQVLQLQPEQLVAGAKHRTAQVLGHAGADPLVAAAAQGGGRAGLVGDATVAAAEHQDLDELVKHQPAGCVGGGSLAGGGRGGPAAGRTGPTTVPGSTMAGQARDLPMRTKGESSVIITARACLVLLHPTGAGPQ